MTGWSGSEGWPDGESWEFAFVVPESDRLFMTGSSGSVAWVNFGFCSRGDIVHVSHSQQAFGFAAVDVYGFDKIAAVGRQLEGSVHFCAPRSFFFRYELTSAPMRGDFLIAVILGFLQLPSVSKNRKFVEIHRLSGQLPGFLRKS